MDRIYPVMVYRDGGPNDRPGGKYSYKTCENEAELFDAQRDGWFESLADVIDPPAWSIEPLTVEYVPPIPDDNAPPTRDELEAKAKELGLKFNKKTSDEYLALAIDAELSLS